MLVSDIGMPDADGYELLKRVRALGPDRGGKVPAIALTAFARSEDRTRALRAGFLVHVSKPVEPSELVATVRASRAASTRSLLNRAISAQSAGDASGDVGSGPFATDNTGHPADHRAKRGWPTGHASAGRRTDRIRVVRVVRGSS